MKKIALIFILFLASCSGGGKVDRNDLSVVNSLFIEDKITSDKNYNLGDVLHSYVGESVVKKKSYKIKTQSMLVAVPVIASSLTSGSDQILLAEGKQFPIRYELVKDGIKYSVFEIPGSDGNFGILFDENGMVYSRVLKNGNEIGSSLKVSPINAMVKPIRQEQVIGKELVENYELVFGGINNSQLNFTYKEYTPEDMAKPAFFQDLTYPTDSESIRYKSLKIKIHKVDSEGITFEVVSD